jgi:hypothetical protein
MTAMLLLIIHKNIELSWSVRDLEEEAFIPHRIASTIFGKNKKKTQEKEKKASHNELLGVSDQVASIAKFFERCSGNGSSSYCTQAISAYARMYVQWMLCSKPVYL